MTSTNSDAEFRKIDPAVERHLAIAGKVSLWVSVLVLILKFWGYHITHSQAILSDALESIANVAAAGLALGVLAVARKPADRDHPYGHGKVEFFSAAFEGGLIFFAAIVIIVEAVRTLFRGAMVTEVEGGLLVIILTGLINAGLGLYLYAKGKKHGSEALLASGKHVLSDVWTTLGVLVGLTLVKMTGKLWLDPLAALIVGISIAATGIQLVRRSAGGLLDEEDPATLKQIRDIFARRRQSGFIQLHHVRVVRSGRYHHIDAHVVVPEFWNVAEAHERTEEFERLIMSEYPQKGELYLHVDPCERRFCRVCDYPDCTIRMQPFEKRTDLSLEEMTSPDEPAQFRKP